MARQYVTFFKNDPIQVATVERIGHSVVYGDSANGYFRGNPIDAPVGVYQVSYESNDAFVEDGFPSNGYKWGTLLVLRSPWSGKTILYFPDSITTVGGFYIKSFWTLGSGKARQWFKVSATLIEDGGGDS